MAPTQPLGPPPLAPAQAIGPPMMVPTQTLGPPHMPASHALRHPQIAPPHSLGPPPMARAQPLGPPPMAHTLGPPPVDHTQAIVPPTMDLIQQLGPPPLSSAQSLVPPPGICRFPLPPRPLSSPSAPCPDTSHLPPMPPRPAIIPASMSCLLPVPLTGQGAPASERPQDEGSHPGTEEQEDSAGLGELCKPLYCKLCNVTLNSAQQAQAHYQGKNHAKKLRLAEAQQNSSTVEGSNETAPRRNRNDGSEYRLVKNRRSPQIPACMPGPYYNPRPRQRIPRDLAMCVTPSGQFYCSMCNCGAEQETDFRQHLESKQHKAKVSELRYRHEMEHLGYS
uniref:Zinc finger, matrin-type 3 n=1 Tax=Gasterosteus aculeatus aculeatus TaxID=481459 RepID=A0AAQ4QUK3_GASAC